MLLFALWSGVSVPCYETEDRAISYGSRFCICILGKRTVSRVISLVCFVCFFGIIFFPTALALANYAHDHDNGGPRLVDKNNVQWRFIESKQDSDQYHSHHNYADGKCMACIVLGNATKQLKLFCLSTNGLSPGSISQDPQVTYFLFPSHLENDTLLELKTKLNN